MKQYNSKKLNILLKQPRKLFHINDLSLLWNISNKNTLHTTIKRYVKKGILLRIHKGFYSTVPIDDLDPVQLGISFIHDYAYLSTETVLARHGVISQPVDYITLISSVSKKFSIKDCSYISRRLKNKYLYNNAGIIEKNNIKQACLGRAVADILYYNPNYHFDVPNLIDWNKVRRIQEIIGFKKS